MAHTDISSWVKSTLHALQQTWEASLSSRAGRSIQDLVSQAAASGATAFRAHLFSSALNAFQFILIQLSFARQAPPCSLRTRSKFYPSFSPQTLALSWHPVSVSGLNMTDDCLVSFARKKYNPLFQTTQEILECVKEDILQDTLHPGKQKQFKVFHKVFDKVKTLAMANLWIYC